MSKYLIILCLVFNGVLLGQGGNSFGSIEGSLVANEKPIQFASVFLTGTSIGAISNEQGVFSLKEVPYGSYVLNIYVTGFENYQQEINISSKKPVSLIINLKPQVLALEEVVITAQYEPKKIGETIQKVKVIDAKTIQKKGAVNLRDALFQELNSRIIHDNVLGSNIILQGLSGQNVKILLDGIPLITGQGNEFDLNQINLNTIDHIEIIEGPLSVQYGTNALAGTVNLVSKKMPDGKLLHTGINTYYESVGQYNADIVLGTNLKSHKISASFGRNQFTGFSSLEEERTMNWNPKTQYFGNLRYSKKIKKLNLGITSNYFDQTSLGLGAPTTTDFYSIATDRYNYTTRWNSNLFLNGKVGKKSYLDFVAGYQKYTRNGIKYLVNLQDNSKKKTDDTADHDTTFFDSWVLRGAYSRKDLIKDTLAFQLGYDLNWNSSVGGRISQSSAILFDGGIFTSFNYKPVKQLELQPALRYTFSSQFSTKEINFLKTGLPIIPSINLKITPRKKTQIRASYANGFREPSLRELYYYFHDANHSIDGNPNLTPETAHNFILFIRHTINRDKWSVQIEPSAYYNNMKDRIYMVYKETVETGDENKVNRTYLNLPYFRTQGGNLNLKFNYKFPP